MALQVTELINHKKNKPTTKPPPNSFLLSLSKTAVMLGICSGSCSGSCAQCKWSLAALKFATRTCFGEMFWLHQSVCRSASGSELLSLKRLLHVRRVLELLWTQRRWPADPLCRCVCVARGLMGHGSDLLEIAHDHSTAVMFDLSWPRSRVASPLGEISAALCSKLRVSSFLCT